MLSKEDKLNRSCTVEACHGEVYAKGYCNKHYNQLRVHGRLTPELEREAYTSGDTECSEPMCHNLIVAKGLCMTHYQQQRRAFADEGQIEANMEEEVVASPPPHRRRVVRRRSA